MILKCNCIDPIIYLHIYSNPTILKLSLSHQILVNYFQGATIKTDEETGKIVIARIMHGGAADRSGLIHVGDEVIEVNGINVEGKTPADVLLILVSHPLINPRGIL